MFNFYQIFPGKTVFLRVNFFHFLNQSGEAKRIFEISVNSWQLWQPVAVKKVSMFNQNILELRFQHI